MAGEWSSSVKDFEEVVNLDYFKASGLLCMTWFWFTETWFTWFCIELELARNKEARVRVREKKPEMGGFKVLLLSGNRSLCEVEVAQTRKLLIKGFTGPWPRPFIFYLCGLDATAAWVIISRPGYWGSSLKFFWLCHCCRQELADHPIGDRLPP